MICESTFREKEWGIVWRDTKTTLGFLGEFSYQKRRDKNEAAWKRICHLDCDLGTRDIFLSSDQSDRKGVYVRWKDYDRIQMSLLAERRKI